MADSEVAEWLLPNETSEFKYGIQKSKRQALSLLSSFVPWGLLLILAAWNVFQYKKPNIHPSQMIYSLYQLIPKESAAQLVNQTIIFPHDPQRRYIIELDVFHQAHCLNMIRKSLHPEYYKGFAPGVVNNHTEDLLFGSQHIDHCIETIRQAIMCHVDVTPYTWIWNSTTKQMQNVFTTPHTCRNFDVVREWAEKNGGNVSAGFDFTFKEMNDPLDESTWRDGYQGE